MNLSFVVGRGRLGASPERNFFSVFYDWSVTYTTTGEYAGYFPRLDKSISGPRRHLHEKCHHVGQRRAIAASQRRSYSIKSPPAVRDAPHGNSIRSITSTSAAKSKDDRGKLLISQTTPNGLPDELRKCMRVMPHSVVVATSTSPPTKTGSQSHDRAMTLSSFTTLTLTPEPIVTFNIRKPSRTLDAIRESGQFNIHTLEGSIRGVNVAKAFAANKHNDQSKLVDGISFPGLGPDRSTILSRMHKNGIEASTAVTGGDPAAPPFLMVPGVSHIITCEVLTEQEGLIAVGDHVLILGRVRSIVTPDRYPEIENTGASAADGEGLLYVQGQYRAVGQELESMEPRSS